MAVTSRFRFWLKFGDTWTTGKSIKIYAAGTTTQIGASTPDIGAGLTVVDNGDGLYYVDALSSGNYDVYVNDVLQTELENYFHSADDITQHTEDDSIHFEIDDAAVSGADVVYSVDKVLALLDDKAEIDDAEVSSTEKTYSIDKILDLLNAIKSYFVMSFSGNITGSGTLDGPGGENGDFPVPVACTLKALYLYTPLGPTQYSQTGSVSFSAGDLVRIYMDPGATFEAIVYKNGASCLILSGITDGSGSYRATLLFEK